MLSPVSFSTATFGRSLLKIPSNLNHSLISPKNDFFQSMISCNRNSQDLFKRSFSKVAQNPTSNTVPKAKNPEAVYDQKKALVYEAKCEKGDTKAMYEYGTCLLKGKNGIKKDFEKAAKYFKMGADKHDVSCVTSYALCLFYGDGVKQDLAKSFTLFKEAAEKGVNKAQYYVGFCYQSGQGVKKDQKEGIRYIKLAADNGYPEACSIYALILSEGTLMPKNIPVANEYFKKAADLGDINGQYLYAMALLTGSGNLKVDKPLAISYLKKAAEQGHSESQLLYGHHLYRGDGVTRNLKEAARFFGLSATQGNPEGCYNFATVLIRGDGIDVDKKDGFKYMKKAADMGHIEAMNRVARMLFTGYGCDTPDVKKAAEYFKKAADQGSLDAMISYGKMAADGVGFDKKEPEEASKYLKMAADEHKKLEAYLLYSTFLADQNNAKESQKYLDLAAATLDSEIIYKYALSLKDDDKKEQFEKCLKIASDLGNKRAMNDYSALIIDNNPAEACKLLKKAVDLGDPGAMFNYALILSDGRYEKKGGPKKDEKNALSYMKKAAEQNNVEAMAAYAEWLLSGFAGQKNFVESTKYFKKAADVSHDPLLQFRCGILYLEGIGLPTKDIKTGASYIKMAADQDLPNAVETIGFLYQEGQGVPKSTKEALKYFKKGAELGYPPSMASYGHYLQNGIAVKKDEKEAAKYYQKGADLKDPTCMYNLALLYATGTGVQENEDTAIKYVKMAAELGFEPAQELLKSLKLPENK